MTGVFRSKLGLGADSITGTTWRSVAQPARKMAARSVAAGNRIRLIMSAIPKG